MAEITEVEPHIMSSSEEPSAVSTPGPPVASPVWSTVASPVGSHVVSLVGIFSTVMRANLRSAAGIPTNSLREIHAALNDGVEWLLSSQRDKDREASRYIDKDTSDVYRGWAERVSQIGREVASLNSKYEEEMVKKWKIWKRRRLKKKIKRALKKVVELLEECPEEILADNLPERFIEKIGVPPIEEFPTLKKALQHIQALMQGNDDGVKCVALEGQEGLGNTIIMQHLNDHFCEEEEEEKEFELVIFIKVPADEGTDMQILQKIADRVKVDREGDECEISGRIQSALKDKRYLLILDGIKNPPDSIWEKLDISKDNRGSKVVIATHYPLASTSKYVDKHVQLEPLSPHEAWNMFRRVVGDKTAQLASPREGGTSSSESTTTIGKLIFRPAIGIPTSSLRDIQVALNDGVEWLLASQRDKDREASRYIDEDTSDVYRGWTERASKIEPEVASLNSKYEEAMRNKWKIWKRRRLKKKIKRALKEVVELLEKCPEEILADNLQERVIKGIGVPPIEEFPTLEKALQDIQALLLGNDDGVKCVALEDQEGLGNTIIMQHLNDHFCEKKEFELVIFIKVPTDERTDIQILQKIADRVKVDRGGDKYEISGRIQSALKDKRYLLILDGIKNSPYGIWEKLHISEHERGSKMVIATNYPLDSTFQYVDKHVQLEPLSPHEAWNMFRRVVGDKTAQLASPWEGGTSSSESTTTIGKLDQLVQHMLSLMRIWSFLHLILSYPIRIGHEEFLKQWINDVYQLCFADDDNDADIDSLRRRVEHLSESPLRYVEDLIPKEILNCGGVSTEKLSEYVPPQPILLLAAHLAVHQLTQTLTSDTIPYSQLPLKKIRHVCFSTRNDAEKRTVVENIQATSQIPAAFDHVQIIDLNQIHDQTQRELQLLSLESRLEQTAKNDRRNRHLVLVVDGDSENKLDPQKLGLPIVRDSGHVVVFITSLSSAQENDELSKKADLTIKTEDHLLPWEAFCKIVGGELLHSNIDIQTIAVQIVKKCGGHLLAVILMAKSLKHETDVEIWERALEKLCYRDREATVNAFFHIIWANLSSETEKIRRIRCLKVFQFKDLMMSDDQLFARWFSQKLVDTEEEAKSILQNFVGCSVLLQFEGPLGRYILLPEDIKIILHTLGEAFPENLREGALESTMSDLQVLNLSYADMQNLYAISTQSQLTELNLEGCRLETLPEAIFKLQKLETLSLEHCSHLRELSSQMDKFENLKELRLAGCEQLKTLPEAIFKLQKLETLSLEHCSQLQKLSPEIAELENLKELRLAGCDQLETLPEKMFKLQKLETLTLEQCWLLMELSPQIAKLENLKELRLVGCKKLKTLPEAIFKLQKLETLSLEHCLLLQELSPQISKLENLKELRLAGCNQLNKLPQEIWGLPNLQTLSLVGTSIFPTSDNQELINADNSLPLFSSRYHEHSGHGKKDTLSSSSAIIQNGFTLQLRVHKEFMKFEQLCQKIMGLQIQNLEICDLSGTNITDPPKILNFPKLKSLLLGNNLNLIEIPSSFFDHVPLLNILNLSRTSIHELPSSIFNLQELKEFYLKDCELLRELPQEISRLRNLTTLDLDGTLITHLPKEIQWLSNLESLSLSFYNESNHSSSFEVITLGVLSQLTNLKVLRISVNPDNEWWFHNFEHILAEINGLKMLQALDIYIPSVNFLKPIERGLSNFRFIIGHHNPRMISCVPPAIEVMFKESGRSLKFVNGLVFPNEVKSILSEARAFFLDRHMKINNLTEFGLNNLKQLRLCILAECNEMQSVIDVDECEADSDLNESFCMQFLTIFYMKNMRSIINRPIFYELKLLALHTCPELTTIFTMDSLHSLVNLEELIVEDCPKVSSIISCPSPSERTTDFFLPRLRKLSLLFVPELASISNGVCIGRNLEQMGLYNCPKLLCLSPVELSSEKLKVVRGETKWWEELKWSEAEWGQEDPLHKFNQIFSPIDEDHGLFTQLTTYELMTSFNRENDSE